MSYLRSKTTGAIIDRSLEVMDCAYYIKEPYWDGETFCFETGDYQDFIESCRQQRDGNGEYLYLCEDGNVYPESDIELVEDADE